VKVNRNKRIAQVLLSLALEGPMTIYSLAKFISKYTCESPQSVRVILYRVLPILLNHGLIKKTREKWRNNIDITIEGYRELFAVFSNSDKSKDIDLLIAYSLEKKYGIDGLLFIISLCNDPFYYDFLYDKSWGVNPKWSVPLYVETPSIKVLFEWSKDHTTVILKELKVNEEYILNELTKYYSPLFIERDLQHEYGLEVFEESVRVNWFLFDFLSRLLSDHDLLMGALRFFEDYGEYLKKVLVDLFLVSFATNVSLLYYQIETYKDLKSQVHIYYSKDQLEILLPSDDVLDRIYRLLKDYIRRKIKCLGDFLWVSWLNV